VMYKFKEDHTNLIIKDCMSKEMAVLF